MTANSLRNAAKNLITGKMDLAVKSFMSPDVGGFGDDFGGAPGGVYYGNTFSSLDYRGEGITGPDGGSWVASIDGNGYNYFRYSSHADCVKAYVKCAPVAAIINKKAAAYINGKTWLMDMSTNKESKAPLANKVRLLLDRPNYLQGHAEFEAQMYIYQQLFGFCVTLCIKPFGFTKFADSTSMWNIPRNVLDITFKPSYFNGMDLADAIDNVVLNIGGQRLPLPLDSLIFTKDFTPSFGQPILPESRILSLEMPINNIIGAYESRNVLINYRGALGVISQDPGSGQLGNLPMSKEQKDDLQRDFRRYGLRGNQMQFIITKAAIKWQQMGYPTRDLMLFEEVEAATQAVCDGYSYPFRLLASNTANSLGGTDAAIFGQQLYQDAIIPESLRIAQQWSQKFGLADAGIKIDKDYSHIAVLQEDKVKLGQARFAMNQALLIEWQNNIITWNQWQVEIGNDPVPGKDIYYTDMVDMGMAFGAQPNRPREVAENEITTNTGKNTAPAN